MKKNVKKIITYAIISILVGVIIYLAYLLKNKKDETINVSENSYDMAFYELVSYSQNVENYLAKSLITKSSSYSAETLTYLWREANLAQTYLCMLPIQSQELENTERFLNQVSDYSLSLSRKTIKGEELSEEDLKNLEILHSYSIEVSQALNQLFSEISSGQVSWKDLNNSGTEFATQVSNNLDAFNAIEDNFHEYSGLIYDGAFSEHLTSEEKKGLTGEEISEEKASEIAKEFIGNDIQEFNKLGYVENANIPVYSFSAKKNNNDISITISKTGGHIVYMNSNRDVSEEKISYEDANKMGKEYLEQKGFMNMKETYYLNEMGILTVNYAYVQDEVVMYPDLIKVKIALDNGEILGIETTGYLNNHTERVLDKYKISLNQAKLRLNKNIDIQSEGKAVIPTKWKTEIQCYEFKGKVNETEFLVYINAETGEEQDILIITNTPSGILTM